jgi:hypothetical protein
MVPEEGVARLSRGGFAIGFCGAAPGFRAHSSRALPRYALGARSRFDLRLFKCYGPWNTAGNFVDEIALEPVVNREDQDGYRPTRHLEGLVGKPVGGVGRFFGTIARQKRIITIWHENGPVAEMWLADNKGTEIGTFKARYLNRYGGARFPMANRRIRWEDAFIKERRSHQRDE